MHVCLVGMKECVVRVSVSWCVSLRARAHVNACLVGMKVFVRASECVCTSECVCCVCVRGHADLCVRVCECGVCE